MSEGLREFFFSLKKQKYINLHAQLDVQLDQSYMNRLTIIKYFYEIAVDFSYKSEPLSSLSLLTFHDSCEFFLDLAADYLEVNKTKLGFLEYWEAINKKLVERSITKKFSQKRPMKRLNRARNSLKHHSIIPTRTDLEAYRVNVKTFLDENIKTIFEIEFLSISLMDLIKNIHAKKVLNLAEEHLAQDNLPDAIGNTAIGFSIIIEEFEKTAKKLFNQNRSPFKFVSRYLTSPTGIYNGELDDFASDVASFADAVSESLYALEEAVRITNLGIDYKKYLIFRSLTPNVGKDEENKFFYGFTNTLDGTKPILPSKQEIRFCINFVLETALKIQEYDTNLPVS